MRIRSRVKLATMEFFEKHGFTQFDAPELTGSAPEGTTELFETDYFDRSAFLSQSGQLYAEAGWSLVVAVVRLKSLKQRIKRYRNLHLKRLKVQQNMCR